ncbi:MAG: GNAT family N-acetyltransferase, partial [Phenylobacterium sp.]
GLKAVARGPAARVSTAPDEAWKAVYLGPGFDPIDGASRVDLLTRSPRNLYGSVSEDGETHAVGLVSLDDGFASIHGMRTAQHRRRQGLAARVLSGLAATAEARGLTRVFLQVEEENGPARALYRQAGMEVAWRYLYCICPDAPP